MQISQSDTALPSNSQSDRIRVGDRVRVRHQRWIVTEIRAHEHCSALTLSGLGPANLGREQQVLTPFDLVEPLASPRSFRIVRPVRWRRACRQLIADAGPAGILRTARTARMDLLPHQLEPALAIVHGRGTRILIADEVGLGKTVQAALIAAELQSRSAASRVLVLTPAGLREQWVDEFANRFDLRLTLFDMTTAARHRALLPVGMNPWSVEPLIVTSIDYIKRPEVLPAVQACRWDVVIVDEAHHAAIATDRHAAVDALCGLAPYVVLLTATPHNGDPQAFDALCALGQHADTLTVFRRTRHQIGLPRERRVHQLRVRPSPPERKMHASLDAFVRAVQREPSGRDPATWLALSTLRKRAVSSAFALQRSIEHRLNTLNATNEPDPSCQPSLPLFDLTGEFDPSDDVPAWTVPAFRDSHHERALLSRVAHAAARAVGRESKLAALSRLLRRMAEPALVFTEYRDTLGHIRDRVVPDAAVLHGGLSRDARRAAIARFQHGGVLLATDAAGEGLNLHHSCRIVVNLELPWNPMRLEQRIGRVDRIGQKRRVHAFHLIAAGTAEVRILQRLDLRVARAQAAIGVQNPLNAAGSVDESRSVTTASMEAEASREHQRLTLARRLSPPTSAGHDACHGVERHALVTFSKRRAIRSSLGSQTLVLYRSVLINHDGQAVAYHITPLRLRRRDDGQWALKDLETLGGWLPRDGLYEAWLASSLAVHSTFWTTRLDRERAIAARHEHTAPHELQPGLFDWRAEHAWRVEHERRGAAIDERTRATTQAIRAAKLDTHAPHIALVLFTS
jgi:superfamily II DNA or RNA helicase